MVDKLGVLSAFCQVIVGFCDMRGSPILIATTKPPCVLDVTNSCDMILGWVSILTKIECLFSTSDGWVTRVVTCMDSGYDWAVLY